MFSIILELQAKGENLASRVNVGGAKIVAVKGTEEKINNPRGG